MARKKKDKKKISSAGKKSRPTIDPDVTKGVWSIILVALAVLSILSFFGKAGTFGDLTANFLVSAFGWGMYIVPILLVGLATAFILSWGRDANRAILFSAALLFSSILGFLAMSNLEQPQQLARGGYLGFFVIWPLIHFLGRLGTFVALSALSIISILLGFNISIGQLIAQIREKKKTRKDALEIAKKSSGLEVPKDAVSSKTNDDKPEFRVKTLGQESTEHEQRDAQKQLEKSLKKSARDDKEKKQPDGVAEFAKGTLAAQIGSFKPPALNLLDVESDKPTSGDIVANANIIKRTFQNFGIDVEMGEVSVGPTVTQYTLKPAEGVKLTRILALHSDLSLALAAHPIRIEAPIPGRSLVGIELPNKAKSWVRLRHLVADPAFIEGEGLTLALGRDVTGTPIYTNLAKMPHMLIAGSTGSGKTIALNTIILSLIYKMPPQRLRFILIDPKRVEFAVFDGIPHLLAPIIVENGKALNALKWAVSEMERRFEVLSSVKARDIETYNNKKEIIEGVGPLPYIVIIIDELADLMASKGKEIEAIIVRIAQMARAVGIHLVLATQRPSVEVITGLIKANITARIAFQVASQVDSRTILDMAGAEKLLGNGDMLFLSPERSKPRRIQGAFVREQEVKKVVEYLRKQKTKTEDESMETHNFETPPPRGGVDPVIDFDTAPSADEADDELYVEARDIVIKSQKASASLLQRRLRIGYARAARMLDLLEENNVIGPGAGAKPRDVYLTADDMDADDFIKNAEKREEEGRED